MNDEAHGKQQLRGHIRWTIREDMPAVLRIELTAFLWPWNAADFQRTLRQRNVTGLVIERADEVAGHAIYKLSPKKIGLWRIFSVPLRQFAGCGILWIYIGGHYATENANDA